MAKKYYGKESMDANKTKATARSGGMISEDYSAPGNLPQSVKIQDYPKVDYAEFAPYPDSIEGVDETSNMDGRGMKRQRSGIKY